MKHIQYNKLSCFFPCRNIVVDVKFERFYNYSEEK